MNRKDAKIRMPADSIILWITVIFKLMRILDFNRDQMFLWLDYIVHKLFSMLHNNFKRLFLIEFTINPISCATSCERGFSISLYLGSKLMPWDPGHGTRNVREDFPEIVFCWTGAMWSVMFCVLLIVLYLWCFPSHRTGPWEGAFNQQERWINYWWWFQNKQFIEVPKLSTHLARLQGYLVLWLGLQVL